MIPLQKFIYQPGESDESGNAALDSNNDQQAADAQHPEKTGENKEHKKGIKRKEYKWSGQFYCSPRQHE